MMVQIKKNYIRYVNFPSKYIQIYSSKRGNLLTDIDCPMTVAFTLEFNEIPALQKFQKRIEIRSSTVPFGDNARVSHF